MSDTIPVTLEAAEKRADLEFAVGVLLQLNGELGLVDVPVGILVDGHDVGDRLAPRQFVGVVLERPDEHHRALLCRDLRGEVVAVIEFGGDPQTHDPDEFVHALVVPEPAKITIVSSSPPTASRMRDRASSRSRVVCSPVPLASV